MKLVTILLDNLTFLMVMLPLIGAWLVLGVSHLGVETARRTALMNVSFSMLLALVMLGNYDATLTRDGDYPVPVRTQMETKLRWGSSTQKIETSNQEASAGNETTPTNSQRIRLGPDVRLAFGIDGISIWFFLLTSALMFPVILCADQREWKHPAIFYAMLLLLQSSLLGIFAAQDVVILFLSLEVSLILTFFLIGWWGGSERKEAARKWFLYQHAGNLCLLLAFAGLTISLFWMWKLRGMEFPLSFALDDQLTGLAFANQTQTTLDYWRSAGPWILFFFLAGIAFLFPIIPLHGWVAPVIKEAPAPVKLLVLGTRLNVGCYLLVRFLIPLAIPLTGDTPHAYLSWLSGLAIFGSVVFALLSLATSNLKNFVCFACLAQLSLAATGFCSLTHSGILGGILHLLQLGFVAGALILLVDAIQRRYHLTELYPFGGLTRQYPRLGICLLLGFLTLIGVPGSGGFASLLLIFSGLSEGSLWTMFWSLLALLLLSWATIRNMQQLLRGTFREYEIPLETPDEVQWIDETVGVVHEHVSLGIVERTDPHDLSWREMGMIAPCLVLVFLIGIAPQFVISRSDRDVQRISRPYQLRFTPVKIRTSANSTLVPPQSSEKD